jgi:penicillin amidase
LADFTGKTYPFPVAILLRLVLALVALAVVAVAGAYFYLQRSLPKDEGEVRLGGLVRSVEVLRDSYGIPHITASSLDDAIYALGFVHAQDRLWQMEVSRRTAAGRLAEVFGEGAIETDRFLRTLGVRRSAEANFAKLDKETRALLETYAAGVNAFIDARPVLPIEFWLTGAQLEPWTPADSLGWIKMMAWDLGGNWREELLRMRLSKTLALARIQEFLPPYPGESPLEITDLRRLYNSIEKDGIRLAENRDRPYFSYREKEGLSLFIDSAVDGLGSNNWVVSGARANRCSPTTRTSGSRPRRCGTSRTSPRRDSMRSARRCPGCLPSSSAGMRISPGASPTPGRTCRTCTSSAWTARATTSRRRVRSRSRCATR